MLSISEKIRGYGTDFISVLRGDNRAEGDMLELRASEDRTPSRSSLSAFLVSEENGSHRFARHSLARAEGQAIELVKDLFRAEYANVQPQSGAHANAAVYRALLRPGDTILGMSTTYGGHLPTTTKPSVGSSSYNAVEYGLCDNGLIDYDEMMRLAVVHRPKIIVAGFSTYSRFLDFQKLRDISDTVGAFLLVDMSHIAGLVAAGLHPSPISFADIVTSTTQKSLRGPKGGLILSKDKGLEILLDHSVRELNRYASLNHMIAAKAECFREAKTHRFQAYQKQVIANARAMTHALVQQGIEIVTGGTDNHIFLIDLRKQNLNTLEASVALQHVGVAVENGEQVQASESPFATSQLRITTSSITDRGFTPTSCARLASVISQVLLQPNDLKTISTAAKAIGLLCADHPLYPSYIGYPNL
ncbi:Serine hydroxymethyltransferase 2 [compost metagenome]